MQTIANLRGMFRLLGKRVDADGVTDVRAKKAAARSSPLHDPAPAINGLYETICIVAFRDKRSRFEVDLIAIYMPLR